MIEWKREGGQGTLRELPERQDKRRNTRDRAKNWSFSRLHHFSSVGRRVAAYVKKCFAGGFSWER